MDWSDLKTLALSHGGVDMATYLHESGYFLAENLLQERLGLPFLPTQESP